MSDPNAVAVAAVEQVATSLGVKVDPVLVAQVAGMVVGVLSGRKWAEAEAAGLEEAAKITTLDAADKAGRARK